MKLSDFRKAYYEYSGKTSDVSRQLAFAGIALVWIFRIPNELRVPDGLLFPTALLAFALGCDLCHYVAGTLIWGGAHRRREKQLKDPNDDPESTAPAWYNYPGNACFVLKVIFVIWAYMLIITYIWNLWYIPD